tara:strand:- start:341 stop:1390 length:1050 start_codon:yes stop_codon:yes gene_type:complete
MKKILLACNNPGPLEQYNILLAGCIKNKIDLYLISEKKMSKFFELRTKDKLLLKKINSDCKKKINNFIKNVNPNLIITGIPNSKFTIEYLTIKFAKKNFIETLCFQDYWGDIGIFNKKVYPDKVFVIDNYAKKLTKKIGTKISNIIVSGNPKEKNNYNLNFKNVYNKKKFIFFLQPLDIPGIKYNFKIFFRLINYFFKDNKPSIKFHPSETKHNMSFFKKNFRFVEEKEKNNLKLFLKYKLIFTCYSTIGSDAYLFFQQNNQNIYKKKMIHLIIGKEIKKTLKSANVDLFKLKYFKNSNVFLDKKKLEKFLYKLKLKGLEQHISNFLRKNKYKQKHKNYNFENYIYEKK